MVYSDSMFTVKTMTEWFPKRISWVGKSYGQYFIPMLQWVKLHQKTNFQHVSGHSGNKYNDVADSLAKQGRLS